MLPYVTGPAAGIAAQRTTDCSRNAHQRFKAAESMTCGLGNQSRQCCSSASYDSTILNRDFGENRFGKAKHDSTDPFITHQNIAAGSKHAKRNVSRASKPRARRKVLHASVAGPATVPARPA